MEFNNAVREDGQHSLRHGSKKANMEKNQNPRIIPCKSSDLNSHSLQEFEMREI